MIGWYVLMAAVSYLLGSVNNAIIICGILKKDIRRLGSGNPGTMNMIRSLGFGWGALTLVLDALKGALPAVLGWYFLGEPFSFEGSRLGMYVCAAAVILGHMFPCYYKFKGGKGVASMLGICCALNPPFTVLLTVLCIGLMILIIVITKIGFIASFIGLGIPIIWQIVIECINGEYISAVILLAIYASIIFMHRANISRFIHGKENKLVLFGKNRSAKIIRNQLRQEAELKKAQSEEQADLTGSNPESK